MSVQFQSAIEWASPGEGVLWANFPQGPFAPLQL